MENFQFKLKNRICNVIATYHDDNTNRDYIVYTDGTKDKENKLKLYYSLYQIVDNNIKLIKAESAYDKNIGLKLIKELIKDIEDKKI